MEPVKPSALKRNRRIFVIVSVILLLIIVGLLRQNKTTSTGSTDPVVSEEQNINPEKAVPVSNTVKSSYDPEKVKELLKDFTQEKDEMEGITWYYHKSKPKYADNNAIYYYVGKKNDQITLRLVVRYSGENWLFVDKLKIQTDKGVYDYTPDEFKRDNANGSVWEWIDIKADKNLVSTIAELVNSKKGTIRFIGSEYYKDKVVTDKEKQALKETFDLFYYSGGQVN